MLIQKNYVHLANLSDIRTKNIKLYNDTDQEVQQKTKLISMQQGKGDLRFFSIDAKQMHWHHTWKAEINVS